MFQGEVWRPFTGQLTHWSWAMALSDLLVIGGAGAWIERRWRRQVVVGIGAALLAVATAVVFGSGFSRYRGSSGVATALVALAGTDMAFRERRIGLAVLFVLGTKITVEAITARPVLTWTLPSRIDLAVVAHMAGALAGMAVGLAMHRGSEGDAA